MLEQVRSILDAKLTASPKVDDISKQAVARHRPPAHHTLYSLFHAPYRGTSRIRNSHPPRIGIGPYTEAYCIFLGRVGFS